MAITVKLKKKQESESKFPLLIRIEEGSRVGELRLIEPTEIPMGTTFVVLKTRATKETLAQYQNKG
jgi:hypothetical protein